MPLSNLPILSTLPHPPYTISMNIVPARSTYYTQCYLPINIYNTRNPPSGNLTIKGTIVQVPNDRLTRKRDGHSQYQRFTALINIHHRSASAHLPPIPNTACIYECIVGYIVSKAKQPTLNRTWSKTRFQNQR